MSDRVNVSEGKIAVADKSTAVQSFGSEELFSNKETQLHDTYAPHIYALSKKRDMFEVKQYIDINFNKKLTLAMLAEPDVPCELQHTPFRRN